MKERKKERKKKKEKESLLHLRNPEFYGKQFDQNVSSLLSCFFQLTLAGLDYLLDSLDTI